MAKPPVLGNDPFQRGAAPRSETPTAKPAAPQASARTDKASSPAPQAKPTAGTKAPAARHGAETKARKAPADAAASRREPKAPPKAKPAVAKPVAAKPTAPVATQPSKVQGARLTTKPAAGGQPKAAAARASKPVEARPPKVAAGKSAGRPASRAGVRPKAPATAEPAAMPTPRAAEPIPAAQEPRKVAEPEATAQPAATPDAYPSAAEAVPGSAGSSGPEPLRPADSSVIEGEVVAVHPPHRSLQVSEPPPPEAEPRAERTSLFDLLRHSTLSTLEGVAQAAMAAFASSRAGRTASAVPGVERAAALGAGVASAATPVFETARALLPPAIGAARTLASAVASGRAFTEAAGTAVDAASALHQAASRTDPSMLEFDLFGEDPSLNSRLEPILDFLHDRYFRVEVFGAGDVPTGPCLIVCNHAGVLPIDGPMMRTVLRRECGRADARWLVEDSIFHAPFIGDLLNRLGAVRACPENAERLLAQRTAVVVFPEGVLGSGKTVRERYRLQRFGRGGFVKLAMRAGVPIVPAAILGAEDTQPLLAKVGSLPITPTFPWLGPVGLLPLPSKWTISFLPPVDVRAHGATGADDLSLVGRITEEVRGTIQGEIDRLLAERETTR